MAKYSLRVVCENCKTAQNIEITTGQTIDEETCEFCKCKLKTVGYVTLGKYNS